MKRPRINITQKFVISLVIISIIPLLAVGLNSYAVSKEILQEEASRYSSTVAADQLDYIDLQMEQVASLITNVSGVEEIINTVHDDNETEDTFTSLATQARMGYILNGYSNLRSLASIDIFSLEGLHYQAGDTLDVSNIRTDVRDEIFAKALNTDQIVLWSGIEDNVNANSTYKKVITVAKALTEVNPETLKTEPIALLLVNLHPDDLYEHFSRIDLGQDAYMILIDGEDRLIYHPNLEYVGLSLAVLEKDLAASFDDNAGELITEVNGQEMFVSYARSSLSDWVVVSLIPVKTVTAKTVVIRNDTATIILISFLFVAAFAWLYNRDVVHPIQQITRRFQRLQKGELDLEMRMTPRGNDEISELVQWFNAFMDTLAARRDAESRIENSLREKEALLQEIHHRVKNNLQVISSLLNLQANRSQDPEIKAVFLDSQNRVRSMSLIHERLYQSQSFAQVDMGEYVRNLAIYLVRSYQTNTGLIDLEIETDKVHLGINTAVPCGLLLNELIANALKHAFPNGRKGKITVLLRAENEEATLIVSDNGVGITDIAAAHNAGTLGLQLIKTLVRQIDGVIKIESNDGAKFTITFDISTASDS